MNETSDEDKTMRAVNDMYNHRSILCQLSDETLSHLPPYILCTYGARWIASVEDRLPPHILERPDIQDLLYCDEHYVNNYPGDQIDGPPPTRRDCKMCNELKDSENVEMKKEKSCSVPSALLCFRV